MRAELQGLFSTKKTRKRLSFWGRNCVIFGSLFFPRFQYAQVSQCLRNKLRDTNPTQSNLRMYAYIALADCLT